MTIDREQADESSPDGRVFPYRRKLPNGRTELVLFEGTEAEVDAWIARHEAVLKEGE